jgi:RHS repeat-associated protein
VGYAKNGETVTYVLGETWEADGADPDTCPESYDITFAREFRYDSGRARYLSRELAPADLLQNPPQFVSLTETWTDYDGDESYGDYTVSGGSAANAGSYELGVASVVPWAGAGNASTSYWHNDLIGTLRNETASDGSGSAARGYTAFGEPMSGPTTRYGYVGSWGYQSHDEVTFLHVGARYYDRATGRFIQRDPIGILGGSHTYSYLGAQPNSATDPTGLSDEMRTFRSMFDSYYREHGAKMYEQYYPPLKPPPVPLPIRPSKPVRPHLPHPMGILTILEGVEVGTAYWVFGGIGATVGEGCMLLYLTPLYSDYEPGTLYKALWKGWGPLSDYFFGL